MVPEKYKKPPQAPPLFNGTKESIVSDAKKLCDTGRAVLDDLVARIKPEDATFANVMAPIVADDDESELSSRILNFYRRVSGDATLRDASTEAVKLMDEVSIEFVMREDIFKLVDAVHSRKTAEADLDAESLRLLDERRKVYIKNGLGLPPGPQRDRFKEIQMRLSQIPVEFQNNLNEENGGLWFSRSQLEGVPEDVLGTLEKGTGENDGKLWLTFKQPHRVPAMRFAVNHETRKQLFIANEKKCSMNVALFKEAIVLRDEKARLLGYPNHAMRIIEDKMAKDPAIVLDFLGDLQTRLTPGGTKELEHLLELKKADMAAQGLPFDGSFYLWDFGYYTRLMVEKEYSTDENKIAQYFPLESTVTGMLRIFEQIFGFKFIELKPEDRKAISPTGRAEDITWHEDVLLFSAWDDESGGDGFVGYLYLDLHPRPGKFTGAGNFRLQPGFLQKDGSRRYPATALVCNFSPPTPKKPSLLKHYEVVTLFHELGHGIHELAGRCRYGQFHGVNTVHDFSEAPSQMLENWCWTPSVLTSLSNHWETGEKIPAYLVDKLITTRHVNGALSNLRQVHYGIFDMTVHMPKSHEDVEKLDMSKLFNSLRLQITGLKGLEAQGAKDDWAHAQASFFHILCGYDAGYYGYLFSEVYSADMFYTAFKVNPMDGKEGRWYRHMVLEKGGSQDEMLTLEQFLGRKPSTEAFYKELGLSN